jgi:glycerol-3-phosphate dehydrogenase (NAD(P)+)
VRAAEPIAVIGAGAWGTALANAAAATSAPVLLWGRDPDQVDDIARRRENMRHLPGIALHPGVRPSASLVECAQAGIVLLVVPAQAVRGMAQALALVLPHGTPVIVCAKGIERGTGLFMTQVIADAAPGLVPAILSGPSFAHDVATGLPTAVTLAAAQGEMAARLATSLTSASLRLYHTDDLRGVEIGGAAKNVLAIAAGLVAGRGLGESAKAALIARGFAELSRFARAWGGRSETLMGLSGLGDLILTCGSDKSRNYATGLRLGAGEPLPPSGSGPLAEGVTTAPVLIDMARTRGIDMPIAGAVAAILSGALELDEAVSQLMSRPTRAEHG